MRTAAKMPAAMPAAMTARKESWRLFRDITADYPLNRPMPIPQCKTPLPPSMPSQDNKVIR
jgi:hypothetical protein